MTSFRHQRSVVRLNEQAEEPYDLTIEGAIAPKRVDSMIAEGAGLKLFYSMERVSESILTSLFDLAEET
ncbi:MAG: glucose-6-phosphate isomerase, partial [Chlamydiota bacterium]